MLEMGATLWSQLIADLARTGKGRRESGAFLLGILKPRRTATGYLLYADVAPDSQHVDYVLLRGRHMAKVWEECERKRTMVVADVHTHPGAPAQSISDQANPIISVAGHVALIVPGFALGEVTPATVGLHQFQGEGRWRSWFGRDAVARLRIS